MLVFRIIGTAIMALFTFLFACACSDKEVSKLARRIALVLSLGAIFTLVSLWVI